MIDRHGTTRCDLPAARGFAVRRVIATGSPVGLGVIEAVIAAPTA